MSARFSALGDPIRLQLIEALRDGPRSVNELADQLHLRQPQTSKHLKLLLDAELITVERQANCRLYSLRLEAFRELVMWSNSLAQMEARMHRLDAHLQRIQSSAKGDETNEKGIEDFD
ncbi:ArsR/SmtB family transcription factor [Exiguobacterium acetylicum]|uniref:ArsR/SmtB family transcription factor n=1 Tax=Exiguobacterium acetylicum TaxID=41170 RepID=UPI0034D6C796